MTHSQPVVTNFFGLEIAPKLLEILVHLNFVTPTPIQQKAIPIAMQGKDIVGIAQTGTGKTLAFALPMLQHLLQKGGRGLVIVPTRELAIQVDETFRKLIPTLGMKTVVLIGGASMFEQLHQLKKNPEVIIATPGRLIDHLFRKTIHLSDVHVIVLDEADRMLDMGFLPQIEQIMSEVPRERQTMIFSATIPPAIIGIASAYMKLPISVEIAPSGTTPEKIEQELFIVKQEMKRTLLEKILVQYHGPVLLFTRTRRAAAKIARSLKSGGHNTAEIHSDRSLPQRREAMEGFKSGKYRILVATDIASRGIDVIGIELIINYDLPDDTENYVHRIGRTGRMGNKGRAITFATPEQRNEINSIESLARTSLQVKEHPDLPVVTFNKPQMVFSSRNYRRSRGSFRRR